MYSAYSRFLISFLLLFIVFFTSFANTSGQSLLNKKGDNKSPSIEIENADEAEYIQGEKYGTGYFKIRGRIRVKLPSGQFIANIVIIDLERQEIYAEGNLVFESLDRSRISAERIIYNHKLSQGVLYNAKGYKKPIYLTTKTLRLLDKQSFALAEVRFTANTARPPHYHFSVKKLAFYGDTFFASGIIYYVGGFPLFAIPFLYSNPWGTGIITQAGRGETHGNFIQNTYHFKKPLSAKGSHFLPTSYSFLLDFYQYTGTNFGLELGHQSIDIDYQLNIGYANFKRYQISDGEITNQVERCQGGVDSGTSRSCTEGEEAFDWHKYQLVLNSRKQNKETNNVRNIHIKFEDYNHYLYDYEFGQRLLPETSISAFYQELRTNEDTIRSQSGWDFNYEEAWDNLSVNLKAIRKTVWRERENFQDSTYELAEDISPSFTLEYLLPVGELPLWNTGIDWTQEYTLERKKEYLESELLQTRNTNQYITDIDFSLPLLAWFYWDIEVGYGIRKTAFDPTTDNATHRSSLDLEGMRDSYQFLYMENKTSIALEASIIDLIHRYKSSFMEEEAELAYVNRKGFSENQNLNEIDISFNYFPLPDLSFQVQTVYDQRVFPERVEDRERWHYPVFRSDILLDWLNLFKESRENLLSKNKIHFFNTHLTNDYIYDPINGDSHSNVFSLLFLAGGYDLWFFQRLRYFELGFQWYHVYFNPDLDHLRYTLKSDIQLSKWSYWELVMESRANIPGRYQSDSLDGEGNSDSVDFWEDIANGTGVNGSEEQDDAIFNVLYFKTTFIFDLNDWEFRLGYELEQRYIPDTGTGLENQIYYEQRLFFALNLIRLDFGSYTQKPSRFLLETRRSPDNNL